MQRFIQTIFLRDPSYPPTQTSSQKSI